MTFKITAKKVFLKERNQCYVDIFQQIHCNVRQGQCQVNECLAFIHVNTIVQIPNQIGSIKRKKI